MSSTLLPFLYQTATLQRVHASRAGRTAFRTLTTTTARHEHKPNQEEDIPFDLPAGYKRPERARKEIRSQIRRQKLGPNDTITPGENRAFLAIFQEIAARQYPSKSANQHDAYEETYSQQQDSDFNNASGLGHAETNSTSPTGVDLVNTIMTDAQQQREQSRTTQKDSLLKPLEQLASAKDTNRAVLRFPPSLRKAAGAVLGADAKVPITKPHLVKKNSMDKVAELESDVETSLSKNVQTDSAVAVNQAKEALQLPERQRIGDLMSKAQSDFELWDIMEAEVFTMVDKLGLRDAKDEDKKTSAKKRSKKSKAAKDKGEVAAEVKYTMDVHGPLYAKLLLKGLILLDRHFAGPSPLALSILPRIKELGLSSYVLGISATFYCQLMHIYWYRHGDMEAVLSLLEEARHAGLYHDKKCLDLLSEFDTFNAKCQSGEMGLFLKELVRKPEFAHLPARARHWRQLIKRSISELGQDGPRP